MSVALACTCRLTRDLDRFQRMRPLLEKVYAGIAVAASTNVSAHVLSEVNDPPFVRTIVQLDGLRSGYLAIEKSLEIPVSHIHYCELDRLLHWIATNPIEWCETVEMIQKTDCLIIGRTEKAFQTYNQAAQQTERVINTVFSRLLGRPIDLCGGNRGFSRRAALFLASHSQPEGLEDAAWPMLLHRTGFRVDYVALDSLDFEHPEGVPESIVRRGQRGWHDTTHDQDPQQWVNKVRSALEIVQDGLVALQQPLTLL